MVEEDPLDEALGALADADRTWIPVVHEGRVTRILSTRDAMRAYRASTERSVRRVRGLDADAVVLDAVIAPGSTLDGRSIADVGLPAGAVVLAVERGERTHVPGGTFVLNGGDRVAVVAEPSVELEVRTLLGSARTSASGGGVP